MTSKTTYPAIGTAPLAAAIALLALGGLTLLVIAGATQSSDAAIMVEMATRRTPTYTTLMRLVSNLGGGAVAIPVAIATAIGLARRRSAGIGWGYFGWALAGWGLEAALKTAVHRPRPGMVSHLDPAGWWSYPSGHAMLTPIVYVGAALLLAPLVRSRVGQVAMLVAACVLSAAVAFSRVYLGVHYPSDVVAGLLGGALWIAAGAVVWRGRRLTPSGESGLM